MFICHKCKHLAKLVNLFAGSNLVEAFDNATLLIVLERVIDF